MHRKIELATNVAIMIVAALLCVVLVKNHLISTPSPSANGLVGNNQNILQTGARLPVSGIDWEQNGQTLLLVLSTTCHFCSESAPFYQQLVKELDSNTRVVAVLPQSVKDSQDYLNRLGVSVDEVKQISLSSINVKGTPTLMLVNSKGIVVNEWVGRLPSDREAEVLTQAQNHRASN